MKLLSILTLNRNFSSTCSRYKFYYSRPVDRRVFKKGSFFEKRIEKTEYEWFKEWEEKEQIDKELANKIEYRPLYPPSVKRATEILKYQFYDEIKNFKHYPKKKYKLGGELNHLLNKQLIFNDFCDIVIIGGGLTGASIAHHIKRIVGDAIHIVIVDKDFSFAESASVNLTGVVKQQFSTSENFELSQYAIQFLDNSVEELSFQKYVPHIDFNYAGYLTLSSEEDADELYENFKIQRELGASLTLLRKDGLKEKFPWINTDGIQHAVLGIGQEGWFDSWSLLAAMYKKLSMKGVHYVCGEVIDANGEISPNVHIARGHPGDFTRIRDVVVRLADGTHRKITCARVVLAAGWRSGELAKIFDIGLGYDVYSDGLPITKRKRYLYYLHVEDGPGLNCPFVMDTSRIYFRREGLGDLYVCGFSINPTEDINADNLKTDDEYFKSEILSVLTHRVKAFKDCKIIRSFAVFHDYNEFDQNPVIGYHPAVPNLFMATGFGENFTNALGAGNYFMEELMERDLTIKLDRCSFQRLQTKEKFIDGAIAYLE